MAVPLPRPHRVAVLFQEGTTGLPAVRSSSNRLSSRVHSSCAARGHAHPRGAGIVAHRVREGAPAAQPRKILETTATQALTSNRHQAKETNMPTVLDVLAQRRVEFDPEVIEKLRRDAEPLFRAIEGFGALLVALAKATEPHGPAIERAIQNLSEPLPVGTPTDSPLLSLRRRRALSGRSLKETAEQEAQNRRENRCCNYGFLIDAGYPFLQVVCSSVPPVFAFDLQVLFRGVPGPVIDVRSALTLLLWVGEGVIEA